MLHDLRLFVSAQADYLVFLGLGFAFFAAAEITLRRRRKGALPWSVWAGSSLLLLLSWWPTQIAGDRAHEAISRLMGAVAPTFADIMEQMGHSRITPATPPDDPLYLRLIETQIRLLKITSPISDVYTMRADPDGKVTFIVDSETDYDRDGRIEGQREQRILIGQVYEHHEDSGLALALAGTANFDRTAYVDEWGEWVSAWMPLRRPDGSLDGVLGVDFPAKDWVEAGKHERRMVLTRSGGVLALLLAGGIAVSLLRRKVTELQVAQEQVRESNERVRQVVDTALDAVITMDEKGRISSWNRQAESMFGWSEAEALGQVLGELIVPPALRAAHAHGMDRYLTTGESKIFGHRLELTALCRDGREIPVELSVNPIFVEGTRHFSSFLRDISARKKSQNELERLAADFANAQRIGNIGSWSLDLTSDTFQCSDQAIHIFGQSREHFDPSRQSFRNALHPEDSERHVRALGDALAKMQPYELETRIIRPDGAIRWVGICGQPIPGADGTATGLSGTIMDITARKESEALVLRSNKLLEEVFENAHASLLVLDPQGRILVANRRAESLLGHSGTPIAGLILRDVLTDRSLLPNKEAFPPLVLEPTVAPVVPLRCKREDGSEFFGEMALRALDSAAAGFLVQIDDTTARELHQRLELRAQRMESIGTLSGGVAHDLNNSLAPILMGIELLRARNPESSLIINTIERCAQRGAAMVKQLLAFARGSEGQRRTITTTKLLDEVAEIARSTFPKNISLITELEPDPWPVSADPTQLHQVLLNLCVNARDAMPEGGTLSFTARNTKIDATFAGNFVDAKAGRYLEWIVADTGEGIPAELIDRIFDPFFTTKGPDKGTGLGLSTAIGIVRSHGGFMRVVSVPGQGSSFHVYLPAVLSSPNTASPFAFDSSDLSGNGETILVVDDERSVREITAEVLGRRNFQVILATDGADALMKVADHPDAIRVVITDLHMPHLNGHQLVRALQRMLPTAGIIVASGRLTPKDTSDFKSSGVVAVIEKPFLQADLFRAVQAALRFGSPQ